MSVLAALALAAVAAQSPAPPASPSAPPPVAVVVPPTAEAVVALVTQAPAFAADKGRTGLQALAEKRLPVPGVGDMGYFVEIQWKEKDGSAQTGLAVVAHEAVRDVPWMVKAAPWGLVQVVEKQTIAGASADLNRERMIDNESIAVADIKTIYSAETLFMAVAEGSYGELRCLNIPADCIADIPPEKLLEKDITVATEKKGYRRKFHQGPRVKAAKSKGSPSPFLKSYAYTAVPIRRGETGMRSYCGDNTGRVCVVEDGSEPPVADGLCTPCRELPASEMK